MEPTSITARMGGGKCTLGDAMARFIGLDVGTSATKAILIDGDGKVLASAERRYPMAIPRPGWTEQNPEDWAEAAQSCLAELGVGGASGIGLTGQMHGSVFLDENDEIIRPALLWNDQRTTAECVQIEDAVGPERLRLLTGNPALTGFQLPKLLWLRNQEPENFRRIRSVLLPKDYIRHLLTGDKLTDASDASGTGCFNVAERQFSAEVLRALDVDLDLFPPVVESYATGGDWNGILIAGGGGDQAAGAVGTGAVKPGILSLSLGTSGVVFEAFDDCPKEQVDAVHNFCHATGGWHRMGVMLSCGGAVSWAKNLLYGAASSYELFNDEASSMPAGCEGLAFLPHLAGERCPFVDPKARGAWLGLGSHHERGHLARAVVEGVCFTLRQCADLMRDDPPDRIRVTGGGARSDFWLQMLADVFGCLVEVPEADEGPSFGAALLAGVAAGHWSGVAAAAQACVRVSKVVEPSQNAYGEFFDRHNRLQDTHRAWSA